MAPAAPLRRGRHGHRKGVVRGLVLLGVPGALEAVLVALDALAVEVREDKDDGPDDGDGGQHPRREEKLPELLFVEP